jgi:hypothetical protein
VLEYSSPRHTVMKPKGLPLGEAIVTIDVRPHPRGCIVRIQEQAMSGPATVLPRAIADIALTIRNKETLRRLSFMAEKR